MKVEEYMMNYDNTSITENGAIGYRTTLKPLLDMNFMVSSLRCYSEECIINMFIKAYYESPKYAVKWLFFLRDIFEGLGERRTFRICMHYLAQSHPDLARKVLPLIPEYGRYDDVLIFLDTELCEETSSFLRKQLNTDLRAIEEGKPISLLAKWLPSINTSSKESRRYAQILAKRFGMDERTYRKTLAALRSYSNVLETKISASKWTEVEYEKVPAKANLKYEGAFVRHDRVRRVEYLKNVIEGDSKLNVNGIMPYEVVHRFMINHRYGEPLKQNLLAELLWEKLSKEGFQNDWGLDGCIVVADGSGSMFSYECGNTSVKAIEICNALAIYFAEQLQGVFHNKVITFSYRPRFIDLNKGKNLKAKLEIMFAHDEVSNTNIEAVFDMILNMAVSKEVPPEEMPKQVLIISDMEFDEAQTTYGLYRRATHAKSLTPALFDEISTRFECAGYKMPRLIFWNVCGRTETIPMVDHDEGICLLSGFSQNAMKIAVDREKKDPYENLIRVLDGERYAKVEAALASLPVAS